MSRVTEVHRRCDICGEYVGEGDGGSLPGPMRAARQDMWDVCAGCLGKPVRELIEKVRERG